MERERKNDHCLGESYSVKVEVEELEDLLGPEVVDVDFRRILKDARDERGRKISETFSLDGLSNFLVAEWSRWDKYRRAPWRQDSSASAREGWWREDEEQPTVGWRPKEKRVMDAVDDYLENCAQVKVEISRWWKVWLRPENLEVSLRYVLKHATRRDSNIFQLFDTSEKPNHFVASRRRWLESQGKMVHGKRVGKTSGMILSIKEQWQKPRRTPNSTLQTPLPQQSSSSARDEEGRWVLMEDRRRRGIAFEKLAPG